MVGREFLNNFTSTPEVLEMKFKIAMMDLLGVGCNRCGTKLYPPDSFIKHEKWHKLHDKEGKKIKKQLQDSFKIVFNRRHLNDE